VPKRLDASRNVEKQSERTVPPSSIVPTTPDGAR